MKLKIFIKLFHLFLIMKTKKAQVSKIFVYVSSIIVIGMVGFLALKFTGTFMSDTNKKIDVDFLNDIEKDFKKSYSTYSSEFKSTYTTTKKINQICFLNENTDNCIEKSGIKNEITNYDDKNIKTLLKNDNMILFSKDDIEYSKNIGNYITDDCFCIKPDSGRFTLFYENIKNQVKISDYKKMITSEN